MVALRKRLHGEDAVLFFKNRCNPLRSCSAGYAVDGKAGINPFFVANIEIVRRVEGHGQTEEYQIKRFG